MKRMTNKEKIDKITSDHIYLLTSVKRKLETNSQDLSKRIGEIVEVLDYEDKNVKEYKAIVRAEDAIDEIMEEIKKSKDINDIIRLRKKLNYYIGKIKNELKKRNVNHIYSKDFEDSLVTLRKTTSTYVRFLKREKNIDDLNRMHIREDELEADELGEYKRLLNNEMRYNKRNIEQENSFKTPENRITAEDKMPTKKRKHNPYFDNFDMQFSHKDSQTPEEREEVSKLFFKFDRQNEQNVVVDDFMVKREIDSKKSENATDACAKIDFSKSYSNIEAREYNDMTNFKFNVNANADLRWASDDKTGYYLDRFELYRERYGITVPEAYNGTVIENIGTLLKNIPHYLHNKGIIKRMIDDFERRYHYDDLDGFIRFTIENNSIRNAFKKVFLTTNLSRRKVECMQAHEEVMDWISEFCLQNDYASKIYVKETA